MSRKAVIKIGLYTAALEQDGQFTSEDMTIQAALNDLLDMYNRVGRSMFKDFPQYWPDDLRGLATAIARYCGGELISCDPPEGGEPFDPARIY